ncbi:stage V sporulation protein AA [Alkaliphilus oremlandii]|uniref:Stage V sporulation protein AA n=1 Tax=Alkaliphilus oremlandii (strain OhILAs) TaxID=350688 RepID=A8MHQ1_ALKOO|nr:stage V sporulation protein AA [Alkaliphilus oremlandii]ABW19333.1 stage V sporulation protein AA [Alkaliphilus oremlandii OhILAs]
MEKNNQIFLRSKGKIMVPKNSAVLLKDMVEISADKEIKTKLENMNYPVDTKNQQFHLISILVIVTFIKEEIPNYEIVVIGETEILIELNDKTKEDPYKILRVALVSFLLFIGAVTAIINFHSDVDMKESHKVIYKVMTGEESERPLLLQIPYSLGIGVGMAVFFNHIFKKKIDDEPTPLEMEMYSYQQSVDEYIKNKTHEQQ